MEEKANYGSNGTSLIISKREMLSALENIPDEGFIMISVDDRDYQKAKKTVPE